MRISRGFCQKNTGSEDTIGGGLDGVEGSSGEEGWSWRLDVYTEDGLWNDGVGNEIVLVRFFYWKWLKTSCPKWEAESWPRGSSPFGRVIHALAWCIPQGSLLYNDLAVHTSPIGFADKINGTL